jgi:hypothetical protein
LAAAVSVDHVALDVEHQGGLIDIVVLRPVWDAPLPLGSPVFAKFVQYDVMFAESISSLGVGS